MIPAFLTINDTIGIVSTARYISEKEIQPALDFLEPLGLKVVLAKHLYCVNNQFAGSQEQRASDFQAMLDNPEIKAILCARGGYGSVQIIDHLDFSNFVAHPKWIIGYSDVTVFHNHINQVLGIPTLHASMPISFPTDSIESMIAFGQSLIGERTNYSVNVQVKRTGSVNASIVGGNLSIICSLLGSKSQLDTRGKILFIEDVDEMLYHLDRMMMALGRAGMLSGLSGLIVGGMTGFRDNTKAFGFKEDNPYGKNAKEIIWEHVKDFDYPVCFDFPAGHQSDNFPLILGAASQVDFVDDTMEIKVTTEL